MISIKNITKIYKKGEAETIALDKISFAIQKGEYVAIMGPSGSGKSTLMQILGILDKPTSGDYLIEGTNINELSKDDLSHLRNKKIGFVFQSFNLLPKATAIDNVTLPMLYGGIKKSDRKLKAIKLLESVGLGNRLDHTSSQLSGGEMQRVAIARSLVMDPEIIFADEPTGNIASSQGREIMNIFDELNAQGRTIVLITHDPEIAKHAKRIIKFQDGKVIADNKKRSTKS